MRVQSYPEPIFKDGEFPTKCFQLIFPLKGVYLDVVEPGFQRFQGDFDRLYVSNNCRWQRSVSPRLIRVRNPYSS